ncbi:MAG: DUF2062 domain-containing protein [Desulfomonilia bacterium]
MGTPYFTRITLLIGNLLKQGISPEKISASIAWGIVLGIFPLPGTTTMLCTIAALSLRLNLIVIQLVNWLVYPLQLALIVPFFLTGAALFGTESLAVDAQEIMILVKADFIQAFELLGAVIFHGVLAWLIISPVLLLAFMYFLPPVLRRIPARSIQ